MEELRYRIGRNADNDLVLHYPQVSGHHAVVSRISDNVLLLEDNNSTNGTFVNDIRIRRATIDSSDVVKMADVSVNLTPYFAPKPPIPKNASPEMVMKAFYELKEVYAAYEESKLKAQSGDEWKKTAIRAGLSLIPFVGNALAIVATRTIDSKEKLLALEKEFKINYVCPKCRTFLGMLPWESLANRNQCPSCRTHWIV